MSNDGSQGPHNLQEYLDNKFSKYPKRSSPLVLLGHKSKNRLDTFLPFQPNQLNHPPRPNVPKYPGPKVNKHLTKPIKQNMHLNKVAENTNVLSPLNRDRIELNFGNPSNPSPGSKLSVLSPGAKTSVPSPGAKLFVPYKSEKPSVLAPGSRLSDLAPGAKPSILAPGSRLSVLAPGSKHRTGDKTSLPLYAESREGSDSALDNRIMSKVSYNFKYFKNPFQRIPHVFLHN